MRYTEARLTVFAELMLRDITEETVDFIKTYDGSEEEPMVLPSAFPNLLANGSSGIAVGMATNIPPHNVEELFTALLKLFQVQTFLQEGKLLIVHNPSERLILKAREQLD